MFVTQWFCSGEGSYLKTLLGFEVPVPRVVGNVEGIENLGKFKRLAFSQCQKNCQITITPSPRSTKYVRPCMA
jgi:hypothetical protein